ncbi:MAG: replicative DNA helicase [Patescibacteria group bacterium]|nr:replicative DNA helicase [Patescibacteria group bacterium]
MNLDSKLPPQDIESEKSILGSIMIDKHAISKVADSLFVQDFYTPAHQKIYSAMLSLFSKNEPIDILSVSNVLTAQGFLDAVGGASYLGDLVTVVPSSSHIGHYAKSVREKRVLRDLIGISSDIHESVFDQGTNVERLIDAVEQRIFSVAQKSQDKRFVLVKDELHSAYERIERIHREGGSAALRGVTTGFPSLDNNLSGFQKSDLVILGARPSLGKTTLALDFARAAAKAGHAVGIFSLEMSKEQIIDRLISSEAQVPLWKLRTGRLSEQDFDMIAQGALDRLSQMKIIVDDTPSLSIMQIRSIARRLQAEHGLELLVIDYVQLIQTTGSSDNVVQQFTEISHGLKALARELNIPVLALSQLNRSVDNRESQIPKISDLRETGSWEQDADVVLLIYRKDRTRNEPSLEDENTASIIIAKHRNGPIGTVDMKFDPERVTFHEIDKRHTNEL